ncbi:MAG: hypothetical protein FP816_19545 [Desulfobacteraceae bacterium]|nr:hypothetical protein [Desulfobacteraceae bacterium]
MGPKIVKTWDEMPPVVFDQCEAFSTRVLEHKFRKMKDALESIASHGLDAKQCMELALTTLNEIKPI